MADIYQKYDDKSGEFADFGDLKARQDLGFVEDTDIAEHTIAAGQYVIWKGKLYTANSAITPDTTLSTSNLTEVSVGGLNKLNDKINSLSVYNFEDTTTPIVPGESWYSLNCAVSGKKMLAIAGFGVWYPQDVRIANIGISYQGTVSIYMINSSNVNRTGFNVNGLYVNS